MSIAKHLLIPDSHVPFEDKRALDLVLKVAAAIQPTEVDILGDFADFYEVSFHSKEPGRKLTFHDECTMVRKRIVEVEQATPKAHHCFIKGNHEFRLDRYLAEKAPELVKEVSLKQLLGLKKWELVEYGDHKKVGRLHLTHDVGYAGMNAHRQTRQEYEGNVVIGHTHRLAVEYKGNVKGSAHVGAMLGWLGDKRAINYMHRAKSAAWVLGFGVAYVESKTGNAHVAPIPIIDYRCVVDGRLFSNAPKKISVPRMTV